MKTLNFKTTRNLILFIFFGLFASMRTIAQCGQVSNVIQCQVTVDITVYDTPPVGCTNVCTFITGVVIQPNSTYVIPCPGCGSLCNVSVTVTDIAGFTTGLPQTADWNTPNMSIPQAPGCNQTVNSDIDYNAFANEFKVRP